ncbi:MAG TPA: hypothetical protein EYN66_22130 [Myxococcales bacterium]|nr:hypothetical protein [Myxococcales bacterium]
MLLDLDVGAGVGQVVIVNGAQVTIGPAENPAQEVGEISEGTWALCLTNDVTAGDIGAAFGQTGTDANEADNLAFAVQDYSLRFGMTSSGATHVWSRTWAFNYRALEFTRRPMSNVTMRFVFENVTSSLEYDVGVLIYYQLAQLEDGDLNLGSILPVGARVVRNMQIPDEGIQGPVGLISMS